MIRYEDIAGSIQVRHIQVPLELALGYTVDAAAESALEELRARGFDRAPVLDGQALVGLVYANRLVELAGSIREVVEPIRPEQLVSADAPVSQALGWLQDAPCLFVLSGRRVTGFFVEADLNKQPARLYFYLLVATLETGLAARLRMWMGHDEELLLSAMPPAVRRRALLARGESRASDTDVDLVAYLTFSDILRIVEHVDDIRTALGSRSRNHWKSIRGPLVELRNAVMHPTRDLLDVRRGLADLAAMDAQLRDLLARLEDATVA